MTDDYPIEGEEVGYVPCRGEAAVLVADEEGAISGMATGYVAEGQEASALPATERAAIVGSAVGFVPRPCCDLDWVYYVWYEDFVPPGAPDGVINALLGPEDNAAKYTGTITGDPTDSGRTWLFAEAVIDCPEIVLANGRVDLYYEVEQETDHIVVTDLPSDTVGIWQLGHLWLGFGTAPPAPPDPPAFPEHYIQFYFRDNVVSGPNLYWYIEVESYGGALFVSDSWPFLQPGPFEAGTRYSIRVRVERGAADNFDLKAKLWKTAETEPAAWMFTPANVDVSNTPLRQLSYAVMNVAQPLHQLESHEVGERHLMALQVNDITLSPQP